MLILAQLSIYSDSMEKGAAPVASLEAPRPVLRDTTGLFQDSVVTFQLKNFSTLPLARVLVNGEPRGEFRDRYVTVYVREGDILEVDGTRYKRPLEIEILDVSDEVVTPAAGTKIRIEGSINNIGRIAFVRAPGLSRVHSGEVINSGLKIRKSCFFPVHQYNLTRVITGLLV